MTTLEEIRNSSAARSLLLARGAAQVLRAEGWTVREAAMHSAGVADAVAMRIWRRAGLTADVRLVVRCHSWSHSGGERVLFSTTDSVAESLRSFCFAETRTGDETLTASARVVPPSTRVRASSFRADDSSFAPVVEETFASVSALICDLHDHELEVYNTDADTFEEAGIANDRESPPHVTFLHPIVLTNAELWTMSDPDRLTSRPSLRLLRTRAASGERSWIDVVQEDAFASFVQNTTRHYANAFKKRRFTAT